MFLFGVLLRVSSEVYETIQIIRKPLNAKRTFTKLNRI